MYIPSVTTVIGREKSFSKVSPAVLETAALRGTAFHQAAWSAVQDLFLAKVDSSIDGYLKSLKVWLELARSEMGFEVIAGEIELTHPALHYKGHPDLIAMVSGKMALIDWKTPAVEDKKSWPLQLAAYWELAKVNGFPIEKAGALRLDKNGGPAKMSWYDSQAYHLSVFLSMTIVERYYGG